MDPAAALRLWRAKRKGLFEIAAVVVLMLVVAAWLMRNWVLPTVWPARFGPSLPTTTRREMLTEMSIVWMFRQELADGRMLSEWNPYWFSGMSWLRFLAYPLYYGVAGFALWTDFSSAATAVHYFSFVLASSGLIMYGFLRHLTGRRLAAVVGAVVYMASPFHNHVGVETWIHSAFWVLFPLSLWAMEWALETGLTPRKKIARLLVAGFLLGLYPVISSEYALIAGPFAVLYLVASLGMDVARQETTWQKALSDVAAIGLMAAGIACFIIVPGLVETSQVGIHAKHAGGTTFDDSLIRDYAVTPGLVIYAVVQRLPLPDSVTAWFSTERLPSIVHSFWSVAWYPGVIAMGLALVGVAQVRRYRTAILAAAGLVLASLFCLGPTFALNPFQYLPVIGRLSPFRGMLLVVTFVALLAGFGADLLLEALQGLDLHKRLIRDRDLPRHTFAGCVTVLLVLLVLLDMAPSSGAYQVTDHYFTDDELAAYAWLNEQSAEGRLWEPESLPRDQYLRTVALEHCDRPRYLGYYDNGAPLYTWQQTAWTDMAITLDLHQVRYVLLNQADATHATLFNDLDEAGYVRAFGSGQTEVWEDVDSGQYARFYPRTALDATDDIYCSFRALPIVLDKGMALVANDDMGREDWDDYDHIIVAPDVREAMLDDKDAPPAYRLFDDVSLYRLPHAPSSNAQLWPERPSWQEIRVEVQTSEPGMLTVAESWYPQWRVSVNGEPADIHRVNWALLGVELESGMHRVRFYFQRPWYVYASLLVSVLTLMAALLCWTRYLAFSLSIPRPKASTEYLTHARGQASTDY